MVTLRWNPNKTKFYVPDKLVCKFVPDRELVLQCQEAGMAPVKGLPIGKMRDTWPFSRLKVIAESEAKTFIGHMERQGYVPQQNYSAMEIFGPYRNKPTVARNVNIEEGNPLVPEGRWALSSKGAWEPDSLRPRALDRDQVLYGGDWKHGVCFLIRGNFLATRGYEEETTGTVIL